MASKWWEVTVSFIGGLLSNQETTLLFKPSLIHTKILLPEVSCRWFFKSIVSFFKCQLINQSHTHGRFRSAAFPVQWAAKKSWPLLPYISHGSKGHDFCDPLYIPDHLRNEQNLRQQIRGRIVWNRFYFVEFGVKCIVLAVWQAASAQFRNEFCERLTELRRKTIRVT